MGAKVHTLSDVAISELSLVFGKFNEKEWAPRNEKAVVLATKAGTPSSTFLDKFAQSIKGQYVKEGTPDTIDNDGDGDSDFEAILNLITSMGSDLQAACWMRDTDMRSSAIVAGISSFIEQLDKMRGVEKAGGSGAVDKAGARHSKADKARLDDMKTHLDNAQDSMKDAKKATVAKIQDHLDKASEHIDKAKDVHTELTSSKYDKPDETETPQEENKENEEDEKAKAAVKAASVVLVDAWKASPTFTEDGLPENLAELETLCDKADKKDDKKKKEPYGEVEYADDGLRADKKKRYPIDTEEHVRAAASYFGMEKNRSKYSSEDQKKIDAKINAAKKKFGIGDSDKKDDKDEKKAGEVNKEEVQAMITEALKASTAEIIAAVKGSVTEEKPAVQVVPVVPAAPTAAEIAAAQLVIEAKAKADADAAKAQETIAKAEADAKAAQKKADDAQAALAEMTTKARAPSATSSHNPPQNGQLTKLQMGVKAQLAANNQPIRF